MEKKSQKSSRFSRFYAGALESAGLGEAAFFLRKAKQNLSYALYAIENMDPEGNITFGSDRISKIVEDIGVALAELELGEQILIQESERMDFAAQEE